MSLASERVNSAFAMPAVRAVKNKEQTQFRIVLADLEKLAIDEGLPIAIVGGLAAIKHGDARETEVAEILVSSTDLSRLLDKASQYGFKVTWKSPSGWHNLLHRSTSIEVNVVPEGGKALRDSPTVIPGPRGVGVRIFGFANLPGWVELKVSTHRAKDQAHVVEVLKKTPATKIAGIRRRLKKVHPSLLARFEEWLKQSQAEKKQERRR